MSETKGIPPGLAAGLRVAEQEARRWEEKLANPHLREAHDLRELAWETAFSRTGDRAQALELIQQASAIDPEYLPQVAGMRSFFERRDRTGKVSLPKTINRLVAPLLASYGFGIWHPSESRTSWRKDCAFTRSRNGLEQRISISSGKFGKQLHMLVSHEQKPQEYVHRDHRAFGCAHAELAYLNQQDLTRATSRLASLLEERVIPWLEASSVGA